MKSVTYLVILMLANIVFAEDSRLDMLAGVYKISPKNQIAYLEEGLSLEYEVGISKKKDEFGNNIIGINEYIKRKIEGGPDVVVAQLKCSGTADLGLDKIFNASMACENDATFEQRINFSQVKDLAEKNFEAPVFSSLYGVEIVMNFERTSSIRK